MRQAVVDIGTNTFILLVAESTGSGIIPIFQQEAFVKLGEGVDKTKHLSAQAIDRGLIQLARFCQIAADHGAKKIHAAGTSALRDAHNRNDFIERAKSELGVQVDILSGNQEALYSFQGAISNKPDLLPPVYTLDIGGGSTELCGQNGQNSLQQFSIDVGSVRMTERFFQHDPPSEPELQQLRQAIADSWQRQAEMLDLRKATLVGVDGTVTTLALMAQNLESYDPNRIDGVILQRKTISTLLKKMAARSLEKRKALTGLAPQRADVIVAGAVILDQIMQLCQCAKIVVSDRGWRFGLAQALSHSQG